MEPDTRITLKFCQDCARGIHMVPRTSGRMYYNSYIVCHTDMAQEAQDKKWEEKHIEQVCKKYADLYYDWMYTLGNCMSTMIAGPANFPVRKAEKANNAERNALDALAAFKPNKYRLYLLKKEERTEKREALKKIDHTIETLWKVGDVSCLNNKTMERVQIRFPGKPDEEMRAELKKRSFRWAPSVGMWQRKNARNGVCNAEGIKGLLEGKE